MGRIDFRLEFGAAWLIGCACGLVSRSSFGFPLGVSRPIFGGPLGEGRRQNRAEYLVSQR